MSLQALGRGWGACWNWRSTAQLPAPVAKWVRVWRSAGLTKCLHHCATFPAQLTPRITQISLPSQILKSNRKGEVSFRTQPEALVLLASRPDLFSPCANGKGGAMSVLLPKDNKATKGAGSCPFHAETALKLVLNGNNIYISHPGFVWNQNSIPWPFTWSLNIKKSPLLISLCGTFHTDILHGLWWVRGYSSWRQGHR